MGEARLVHGCALLLGRTGVLIRGPSGSGKTRTAQLLIKQYGTENRFARWVADDQVLLQRYSDTVITSAPGTIAGLAEQRFCGIHRVDHEPRARLDLVVNLVPENEIERLPENDHVCLWDGAPRLPLICAPSSRADFAAEIICGKLHTGFTQN